jgi:UDP-N-acetylglucosamine--N-acetylmuramyl-(pentapeptide) pyrophosphoryl-undecaprenol N-acetylglucosamine transferase
MVISLLQTLVITIRFKPDVVVGTGGYESWPVLTAGIILKKKTVIQEQNRAPGLVTRILSSHVDSVHLSFEDSKRYFKKQTNLHVSGNPTRDDLEQANRSDGYSHYGLRRGKTTLFIFGGSQGSLPINEAISDILDRILQKTDAQILWSTGPRWFEGIQERTEAYRNRVKVYPYIEEMGLAYGVADLLICRAGATTVAEVTRLGVPAVFIPFSKAAAAHQAENARLLQQKGAAEMVMEEEIAEGKLERVIVELSADTGRLKEMGMKAKEFGKPDAAKIIADDIIKKGYQSETETEYTYR